LPQNVNSRIASGETLLAGAAAVGVTLLQLVISIWTEFPAMSAPGLIEKIKCFNLESIGETDNYPPWVICRSMSFVGDVGD